MTIAATPLVVGPSKHFRGGTVCFGRYRSGERVIYVVDRVTGEREYVATTAITLHGAPYPGIHGVWLKDWSENEGVANALVSAGVVTLTGRVFNVGYASALHAVLTEAAIKHLPQELQ